MPHKLILAVKNTEEVTEFTCDPNHPDNVLLVMNIIAVESKTRGARDTFIMKTDN